LATINFKDEDHKYILDLLLDGDFFVNDMPTIMYMIETSYICKALNESKIDEKGFQISVLSSTINENYKNH
jgi:hypothetical protein